MICIYSHCKFLYCIDVLFPSDVRADSPPGTDCAGRGRVIAPAAANLLLDGDLDRQYQACCSAYSGHAERGSDKQ